MALLFEHVTCSRCAGSGNYSIGVCFRCHGQKQTLTRRGRAAQDYFTRLKTRTYDEVKLGDWVWLLGFTMGGQTFRYTGKVMSIKRTGDARIIFAKAKKFDDYMLHGTVTSTIEVSLWGEEKKEAVAKALAYQATLGVQGKPVKTKAKAVA